MVVPLPDFSDVPSDVYTYGIGAYATLHDLYFRRYVSHNDLARYKRALTTVDESTLLGLLRPRDLQLLHDWLQTHLSAGTVNLDPDAAVLFLYRLSEVEKQAGGDRTLVEVALSFPEMATALDHFFNDFLIKSDDGYSTVLLKSRLFKNLITLEGLARRTVLPWIKADPSRFRRTFMWSGDTNLRYKQAFLGLLAKYEIWLSKQQVDSLVDRYQSFDAEVFRTIAKRLRSYPYQDPDIAIGGR